MYVVFNLLGPLIYFKILLKRLSNVIPIPEQRLDGFTIHRFVSPSMKNCGQNVLILRFKPSNRS